MGLAELRRARLKAFLDKERLSEERFNKLLQDGCSSLRTGILLTQKEKKVLLAYFDHEVSLGPLDELPFTLAYIFHPYPQSVVDCFGCLVKMGLAKDWRNENGITIGEYQDHLVEALAAVPTRD